MGVLASLLAAAVIAAPSPTLVPLRQSPNCSGANFCPGDRDPQWSPDGRSIAFVRHVAAPLGAQGQFRLMVLDVASGRERPVREAGPTPTTGAWSPDSARLVREGGLVVDLRTGATASVNPPQASARSAVWSPDGTKIALLRYFSSRFGPGWCCELYIANADGSGGQSLGGGRTSSDRYDSPAWSPNGRLAFTLRQAEGDVDVWIVDADGSNRRRLTNDPWPERQLQWSPDGSRLYYLADNSAGTELLHVDMQSGSVSYDNGDRAGQPLQRFAIASDGSGIALVRGGADTWRISLDTGPDHESYLADGVTAQARPALTSVSWSPLGRLAYLADGQCPTVLGIHVAAEDGTGVHRLTERCRIDGTKGPDRLRGTEKTDALCGHGGSDTIEAGKGPDFVQGGTGGDTVHGGEGDDRIFGGPGRDALDGGSGWDAIGARDAERDRIRCGTGNDVVWADRLDVIAPDCERVERA